MNNYKPSKKLKELKVKWEKQKRKNACEGCGRQKGEGWQDNIFCINCN